MGDEESYAHWLMESHMEHTMIWGIVALARALQVPGGAGVEN